MTSSRSAVLAAALVLVLSGGARALADTIELNDGTIVIGSIVAETPTAITIRTEYDTTTYAKKQVVKVWRDWSTTEIPLDRKGAQPPATPPAAPGSPPVPSSPAAPGFAAPWPPSAGKLVARVGPGGVSERELEAYLVHGARERGKGVAELTKEERRVVLEAAIDEEAIFQLAIARGMLRDEYVSWRIISEYRARETVGKVEPRSFTEEELRAYWRAHPQEFTEPPRVRLEVIELVADTPRAEVEAALAAARGGGTPAGQRWREIGWVEEGQALPPLSIDETAPAAALRPGEAVVIENRILRGPILFRAIERKEARLLPFEELPGQGHVPPRRREERRALEEARRAPRRRIARGRERVPGGDRGRRRARLGGAEVRGQRVRGETKGESHRPCHRGTAAFFGRGARPGSVWFAVIRRSREGESQRRGDRDDVTTDLLEATASALPRARLEVHNAARPLRPRRLRREAIVRSGPAGAAEERGTCRDRSGPSSGASWACCSKRCFRPRRAIRSR